MTTEPLRNISREEWLAAMVGAIDTGINRLEEARRHPEDVEAFGVAIAYAGGVSATGCGQLEAADDCAAAIRLSIRETEQVTIERTASAPRGLAELLEEFEEACFQTYSDQGEARGRKIADVKAEILASFQEVTDEAN